jgi:hypothetical protein
MPWGFQTFLIVAPKCTLFLFEDVGSTWYTLVQRISVASP